MSENNDEFYQSKVDQFGHTMTILKWSTLACLVATLIIMNIID